MDFNEFDRVDGLSQKKKNEEFRSEIEMRKRNERRRGGDSNSTDGGEKEEGVKRMAGLPLPNRRRRKKGEMVLVGASGTEPSG